MSDDAIHPPARPSLLRRLRYTPLGDLARGRATGRLDVRHRLAALDLPPPAADLVRRVARRTRLWRAERIDVADELAAHFADGLADGESAEALVAAFGDERRAARLIRRAKVRNRPLAWHALRWTRWAAAVLLLVYAAAAVRFFVGVPTITVDYVAAINAEAGRASADQRAWPLYAQALAGLYPEAAADPLGRHRAPASGPEWAAAQARADQFSARVEAQPGGPHWADLGAWLDEHAADVELIRRAAARPVLGFVHGPAGSIPEPPPDGPVALDDTRYALVGVPIPYVNITRQLADVLSADLRWAREHGDGKRAARALEAQLGIADHLRGPLVVNLLVGLGIDGLAMYNLDQTLANRPDVLDDVALVRLAHRLADLGARTPLADLDGERMVVRDMIQRSFTDDGHGDGRVTPVGLRLFEGLGSGPRPDRAALAVAAAPAGLVASRRAQLAEYDRLMDAAAAQLRRPAREADWSAVHARIVEIKSSDVERLRYLPLAVLMPSLNRLHVQVERALGQRDGLLAGIALELYRRRHGGYPPTLAALVPALLPAVPIDRITGDPVRYKLSGGRPVVYSVGVDRDDDGGRPVVGRSGRVDVWAAADWPHPNSGTDVRASADGSRSGPTGDTGSPGRPDGDWVLYPEPVDPEPTDPAARP